MKTVSRFDEAASQWDNNPTRVQLAAALGAAIQKTVPLQPHWRVLDYGAGTGLISLSLQSQVASLVALDASGGMLAKLAEKLEAFGIKNVVPRQWNLESDPFPEAEFDLVISSMTFHHLRDIPLVLGRLAALLKRGGWVAIADLDAEDGSFHGQSDDVFHHGFDRGQIVRWLHDAGFAGVSVGDAHTTIKPAATGELRSYGVFLAVGQKS